MTAPLSYPLAQLLIIKKNRFEQAIKILEEKKELLAKAQKKLQECQEERNKAFQHKVDKLTQLRKALDEGTTSDKVQQMKAYLKVVDEKLADKERKLAAQKKQVDLAQKQVDLATQEMFQRQKDLEKLEIHKAEWEKEVRYWTTQKETLEQDEQGSATFLRRRREEEERRKHDNSDS